MHIGSNPSVATRHLEPERIRLGMGTGIPSIPRQERLGGHLNVCNA